MSRSRSALSSVVVTFNNLVEEVREGLRWQKEDEEKMVEVECDREDLAMDQDSFMEYGEELESDLSFIEYPDTPDDRMRVIFMILSMRTHLRTVMRA